MEVFFCEIQKFFQLFLAEHERARQKPHGFGKLRGKGGIGGGFPVGDIQKKRPYLLLEGGAVGMEWEGDFCGIPGKVGIQPAFCLC